MRDEIIQAFPKRDETWMTFGNCLRSSPGTKEGLKQGLKSCHLRDTERWVATQTLVRIAIRKLELTT
jgi:hypothetical protein